MMTALPLERHELFHSKDLDETRELVGQIFCDHRLHLVNRDFGLNARMHTCRVNQVTANYISYGGNVSIEPGWLGSFYVVQIPLSGRALVHYRGERVYSTVNLATVISPTEYLRQVWSADCAQIILRIERSAMHACLRDLLGVPLWEPLVFETGFDVSAGYGAAWVRSFYDLIRELEREQQTLLNDNLAARSLENMLMTYLLVAQRHNYSKFLRESRPLIVPSRAVNVARELIESNPEKMHTVPRLARAANVSARTLQAGFNEHLNMSPRAYLTDVRMRRARDELRAAEYRTVTVSRISRRLGFNHPGRFAVDYKKRFGESPSETLRK